MKERTSDCFIPERYARLRGKIDPPPYVNISTRPTYNMMPVESSNVAAIGYDPQWHFMRIEFKNGTAYEYDPISNEDWDYFKNSSSKGKWVWYVLRPRCRAGIINYRKMSGPGGKPPNPDAKIFLAEPPAATYPGGYAAYRRDHPQLFGGPLPAGRLGNILQRDRDMAAARATNATAPGPATATAQTTLGKIEQGAMQWLGRLLGGKR
jgi:hypothetical protein